MRKVIAILFSCILLFNLTGYYLFYQFRLQEVKTVMKASLRRNQHREQLQHFNISLTDEKSLSRLQWEDDHEFRLDGIMYDVVAMKREGGRLLISCISDKEENNLLQQYQQTTKDNNPVSKSRSVSLLKIVSSPYHLHTTAQLPALIPVETFYFPFNATALPAAELSILTPPPQVVHNI